MGTSRSANRCALLVAATARDLDSVDGQTDVRLRPPLLSPGMVVANRYQVRRLLGAGAMGEVHEVDDRLLGTVVALKTLNAMRSGDDRALARLKREVAAARQVTHPNVCRIFDLGVDRDDALLGQLVFLTMEYLSGATLAKHLRIKGPLSPAEALPLLMQLGDGLAAAHAAGIIHRDLKAENVMLIEQADGATRAVITDFGLAGFAAQDEGATERGSGFSGTLAYAAPERITGGRATEASDVYSFGLIAIEMLTGAPPSTMGVAPTSLSGAPEGWAHVLARATERDPHARLPHGGALADALRSLARPEGRRSLSPGVRLALGGLVTTILIAATAVAWVAGAAPPAAGVTPPQERATVIGTPTPVTAASQGAVVMPRAQDGLAKPRRTRRPQRVVGPAVGELSPPTVAPGETAVAPTDNLVLGDLLR